MQFLNGLLCQTIGEQFGIHIVETDLIEFVNGYGDIYNFLGFANHFGNTGKNLAVIDFDSHTYAKAVEHLVYDLHQLYFVEQAVGANHVGITLIELSVSTFLRTVGTPHGLNLIALKRHLQFLPVLHHEASKRHCQIVAKSFLTELSSQVSDVVFL